MYVAKKMYLDVCESISVVPYCELQSAFQCQSGSMQTLLQFACTWSASITMRSPLHIHHLRVGVSVFAFSHLSVSQRLSMSSYTTMSIYSFRAILCLHIFRESSCIIIVSCNSMFPYIFVIVRVSLFFSYNSIALFLFCSILIFLYLFHRLLYLFIYYIHIHVTLSFRAYPYLFLCLTMSTHIFFMLSCENIIILIFIIKIPFT